MLLLIQYKLPTELEKKPYGELERLITKIKEEESPLGSHLFFPVVINDSHSNGRCTDM